MSKSNDYFEIDIMQLLQSVWHYLWAILLAAVVCGAAMFSYANATSTSYYTAQAMLYVNSSDISIGSYSISSGQLSTGNRLISTYVVILKSRTTLNEIIDEAGLPYTPNQLSGMISAQAVDETEVFQISVTGTNAEETALIANTIVEVLPEKITDIMNGCSVKIIDRAIVPTASSGSNATRYAEIGVLLGVALSCVVLVIRMLSDKVIHNEDYLMETYKLPILTVVPDLFDDGDGFGYVSEETKRKVRAMK